MRDACAATAFVAVLVLSSSVALVQDQAHRAEAGAPAGSALLWRAPEDIGSRNLYYGAGGVEDQPRGAVTFIEEDLNGTNPKFEVRDLDGTRWIVKLGAEARPEIPASRLVWAVGYFTSEDYFLPELTIQGLPPHLKRGQDLIEPGGIVRNVRLKRQLRGQRKVGAWLWGQNPFVGTQELDGLRVMMALINNWDLKDENNAIYEFTDRLDRPERIYLVSDLGSSFGTSGIHLSKEVSKGDLQSYASSDFITNTAPDEVDFAVPSRPALVFLFTPRSFVSRLGLRWIGRHIPRAHARWVGQILARLSAGQVRDAFHAAGYSSQQVEGFTRVVQERIAALNRL
jgi:hypothetical protein